MLVTTTAAQIVAKTVVSDSNQPLYLSQVGIPGEGQHTISPAALIEWSHAGTQEGMEISEITVWLGGTMVNLQMTPDTALVIADGPIRRP